MPLEQTEDETAWVTEAQGVILEGAAEVKRPDMVELRGMRGSRGHAPALHTCVI